MSGEAERGTMRARRWRRRKEARPHEIIAAAKDLFTSQGFAATKMDDLANAAGVTPGTIYRYFENKEAVLEAVVYESMGAVLAYAHRRIEDYEGDSFQLLRELAEEWWDQFNAARLSGIPKLIMTEASNFPDLARFYVEEVIHRGRRIFERALERGVARGEFRPLDIALTARLAMAPLQYALTYQHSLLPYDSEGLDIEPFIENYLEIFSAGLRASAATLPEQ